MLLSAVGLVLLCQTPPVPPVPPARPPQVGQPQQLPGRDQQQRPPVVGKATLSGTVVSETGQPLKGARVSASGGAVGRSVITDATGSFVFEKLPEGRYTLSASKQRYLSSSFGQKRPERSGTAVQVADGEHIKNLAITLFSSGVITGAVYGDDGEAVQGAQVRAMRYVMNSGVRRLQNANSAQTDDRGMYRIFGLTPGEYLVTATSNQGEMNAQMTADMAVAIERSAAAAAAAGNNRDAFSYSMNNGVLMLPGGETMEAPSPVTFAPTYYPGSTSPAAAVAVPVRGGEERSGVDISLQKVQTATVSGTVISGAGPLPQNISLSLQSTAEAGQGVPLPSARVGPDGRFSMRSVPPGQYTIVARSTTTVRTAVPAGGVAAGAQAVEIQQGMQTTQVTTTGRASISVDGQPLSGVIIALDGGRTLTGRVNFAGAAPPDLTKLRLTATLQSVPTAISMNMPMPQPATIGTDGAFRISGISPGRYTLRVSGAQGWSLKSSVVDGRDSLDFPFDVDTEDIRDAIVTMAPPGTPAELSGILTDQQSKPVSDYTILVFTSDQRFWAPGSRRIYSARPGTDGKYLVRGMQPGDYHVAALSDLEPGVQFDPEFLKSLLVASTRVTVGEGAKLTQDLRISAQWLMVIGQ